mgnify:CR=1 FL=1
MVAPNILKVVDIVTSIGKMKCLVGIVENAVRLMILICR